MKKQLSDFTTEDLTKEVKRRKVFFYMYLLCIVIMAITSLFNISQKEYKTTNFLAIIFLPICIMMWKNYNVAIKELNSRK